MQRLIRRISLQIAVVNGCPQQGCLEEIERAGFQGTRYDEVFNGCRPRLGEIKTIAVPGGLESEKGARG
ncbi:hypothetical protein CFL01nite_02140 [Corynebacterium flavescens]|uniref:Uncharacterized protein n=1 Tax=Corynebacterium flavescens TaxID=28028 RepID=A0AB73B4G9_CORFL|nr:hypothetical protein CFL01nite_02140 [Corynebacterium flavescens]